MGIIINPRQIIKDGLTSLRDVWSSSKVANELSGKQATLVSGTNIKTINGNSLLGSGDITISGGGDIPKINMTATTATLDPNKFYVWGEVASLDITLASEVADIENIYKFQFQSGNVATTLSLPDDIVFYGEMPNKPNILYIVSIQSNIAKIERLFYDSNIPNDYKLVEYIEGTGTQYIDTGIIGTALTGLYVELTGYQNVIWGFGARSSLNNAIYIGNGGSGGNVYQAAFCNYDGFRNVNNTKNNDGQKHIYSIVKGTFKVDDDELTVFATGSFDTGCNIYLLAYNNVGIAQCRNYKIHHCSITDVNDVQQADLYPCYRIADNVAGMYDIVRGVFLTNAGTGSFIVGPDV